MNNKIALITAATQGIGWAAAHRLACEGATVYISSIQTDIDAAKEKIEQCNRDGLKISPIVYDAFDEATYPPMVSAVLEKEGRIDILVNNFGYTNPKKDLDVAHIDYHDFERFLNVNLQSVLLPTQLVLPSMQKNGGCIINISSIAAHVPDMTQMAYGTAKAAICHITKMVAAQQAFYGIRCNAVLPGVVATGAVMKHLTPEYQQSMLRHVPAGRMAQPDELGDAVAFLSANGYVTGQLLEVAGGFGLPTPLYADLVARMSK